MQELIFEVTQEVDGGYCAECLTEAIVTQGDTWEELRENVKEAVKGFYFDRPHEVLVLYVCTWCGTKSSPMHEAAPRS
jgi:hypothetical protein